ncbi:hypothetical protein DQP58_04785 [Mycobacterium colombiense]|uniref:Helix-turn-helix domain-containing protein n=1 Tax=Mycobacterium colombiense TaxID=339268 RepID=A0A329KW83_9MYCO|nr:helix-turn-helix domain-containing protein [Mycobacterium colombiense]RAU98772.1 hypothetical protein DQP58_04785 [Mycobacterium colombiense]
MSDPEPIVIGLTATEAQSAHYALRDFIARRGLEKRPLPRRFYTLQARLVSFVRETKTCAPQTHSASSAEEELIDTAEAAAIIDRSPQWVRRIRAELGGRDIGGRYVFPRKTVVQYAERKAVHHK